MHVLTVIGSIGNALQQQEAHCVEVWHKAPTIRVPQPLAPVGPLLPVAPVLPLAPVRPVAPVTPVEPVDPVAPVAPVEPVTPVRPVCPVAPAKHNDEAQSGLLSSIICWMGSAVTPLIPSCNSCCQQRDSCHQKRVSPVAPVTPIAPVAPVTPVEPVKPVAPVKPVLPVAPARQTNSNLFHR